MKNEIECEGCMYRQVPEHFVPCLGCKNNTIRSNEAAVIEKTMRQQDNNFPCHHGSSKL